MSWEPYINTKSLDQDFMLEHIFFGELVSARPTFVRTNELSSSVCLTEWLYFVPEIFREKVINKANTILIELYGEKVLPNLIHVFILKFQRWIYEEIESRRLTKYGFRDDLV